MVMLTLTRDNLDQVLPLGELRRGRADVFPFNRLSPVGAAADLLLPEPTAYRAFLAAYLAATETNPAVAQGLGGDPFTDRDPFCDRTLTGRTSGAATS